MISTRITLVAALPIAPSEAQRRALLVDTPKRFYRFPRKLARKP